MKNTIYDPKIRNIINTLILAGTSDSIAVVSIGNILMVYNGTETLHRYKCSNRIEAEKAAERIQTAYEHGYFQNRKVM